MVDMVDSMAYSRPPPPRPMKGHWGFIDEETAEPSRSACSRGMSKDGCQICQHTTVSPVCLPCTENVHHTQYCVECLDRWWTHYTNGSPTCPFCRGTVKRAFVRIWDKEHPSHKQWVAFSISQNRGTENGAKSLGEAVKQYLGWEHREPGRLRADLELYDATKFRTRPTSPLSRPSRQMVQRAPERVVYDSEDHSRTAQDSDSEEYITVRTSGRGRKRRMVYDSEDD